VKAVLSIIGASCLALTAGCTNLIEITEGFKAKQTGDKPNPQSVEENGARELPKATTQTSTQNRQPATRVIWEGEMNDGYYCELDNGVVKHKGEGPCSEYLGVCSHENGYEVNCSDCTPMGNCR